MPRAGPGLTYDILTTVPQGTWTKITGIDTLGEWYRVELDDLDQPAWIIPRLHQGSRRLAGGADTDRSGRYPVANGWTADQFDHGRTVVAAGRRGRSGCQLAGFQRLRAAVQSLSPLQHRLDHLHFSGTGDNSSTVNSKSLSFSTLSGTSFISAWCGTMAAGREIAEVEIDPVVAGTYSSTTTSGGLAAVPPGTDDSSR